MCHENLQERAEEDLPSMDSEWPVTKTDDHQEHLKHDECGGKSEWTPAKQRENSIWMKRTDGKF